jgi:hypothetical protein
MVRAYAGIVAPLLVLATLLIFGATTPGYDPVRQTISEFGPGFGGTSTVALYGFALAVCACQPISQAARRSLSSPLLITILMIIAVGCIGISLVAPEPWPWRSMGWQGRLHLIFAFVFVFAAIPAACFVAAEALPTNWRGLRAYSLATGILTFALLGSTLVALSHSPPNQFVATHLGLIERLYVFAFLIWQCIVSTRCVRPMHA